jgi:hypothetical protein
LEQCSDKHLKNTNFSGNNGYHTLTQLIGVNKKKRISLSPAVILVVPQIETSPDSMKISFLRNLKKDEKINADLGYSIYTHITGEKTRAQKKFNLLLKHFISVVGNSISHIRKRKFCLNRFDTKLKLITKAIEKNDFII